MNGLEIGPVEGVQRHLRVGQEFYPHRFSITASASGPVVFVGFGISAPHLGYDDYNGDVKNTIVLALDHEPGERDANSPFDGVVTSESSTVWRKALAAQDKGALAVLFVSDVHNHPDVANFDATARNYWPATPPRILNYMLAEWADRIRIPVAQISPAIAASLVGRTGRTLEESGARVRNRSRLHAAAAAGDTRVSAHVGRPSRGAGSQRRRAARGRRSAAEGRVGNRLCALRPQRRRPPRRSSTARTTTARASSRSWRLPRPTRWRRRTVTGRSAACSSPRELRGARAARRVGVHRAPARAVEQHRGGAEHGHDRP